jgi:hypothetical protein
MNERVIYAHELRADQKVIILMHGEIDLETIEAIEQFCHRQRFRICERMKAELDAPSEASPEKTSRQPSAFEQANRIDPSRDGPGDTRGEKHG